MDMFVVKELCDIRQRAKNCALDKRLDGKTVIITGGNSGIGKETAIDLARRGARVLICCRNEEKALNAIDVIKRNSNSDNVQYYLMDLASFRSIRHAAAIILENELNIDILINNAAVMMCPFELTVDGYELQFATNHLGHFLLTLLLIKRIRESKEARIIIVSSSYHRMGKIDFENLNGEKSYSPTLAYANSKLANILFATELSRRLQGTGINVYSLHPGIVQTELVKSIESCVQRFLINSITRLFGKSATQGAQTHIYCAVNKEIGTETGFYYVNCEKVEPSKQAIDEDTAKKLWQVSLEMVGLVDYCDI